MFEGGKLSGAPAARIEDYLGPASPQKPPCNNCNLRSIHADTCPNHPWHKYIKSDKIKCLERLDSTLNLSMADTDNSNKEISINQKKNNPY